MLKRYFIANFLLVALLGLNFQIAFAQSNQDWSKVTAQTDKIIAVQPKVGETIFGKLKSVNNDEIVLQIANKKELTNETTTFNQSQVKKVWNAELRFGGVDGKSVAIGAGVGAGVGLGFVAIALAATGGSDSSGEFITMFAAAGAGAGAGLAVLFSRKKHKKRELIFSVK